MKKCNQSHDSYPYPDREIEQTRSGEGVSETGRGWREFLSSPHPIPLLFIFVLAGSFVLIA